MDFSNLLRFDHMVTPRIITVIYWIEIVIIIIAGIVTMFTFNFFAGLFGIIALLIGLRIGCELLVVLFRMNEALQALRNRQEPLVP